MNRASAAAPAGRLTPGRWVAVTVAAFGLVGGAVGLVDMFDVGGARDALDTPVWLLIYRDSVVVDFAHWAVLAAGLLLAGGFAGRLKAAGARALGAFWTLLAVGLMLLLINATGRPLNFAGVVAQHMWGVSPLTTRLVIVVAIAAVMFWALVRYGRHAWRFRPARPYLVAAFAVYAVAVLMAATGHRWYGIAGSWLDLLLFRHRLPRDPSPVVHEIQLMEIMVQPSVELLTAALFLALALAFRAHPHLRPKAEAAKTSG